MPWDAVLGFDFTGTSATRRKQILCCRCYYEDHFVYCRGLIAIHAQQYQERIACEKYPHLRGRP